MKKNMFKTRRWASVLQVLFLAAMVCIFIFLVIYFAGTVFKGYKIVPQDTVYLDTFVYLDADYAFEPVAHDEEGMRYAFVLTEHDQEYYKYLIRLSEKDYEESGLKTLVSESEECVNDEKPASAPLHLTGYVVHAGEELRNVAGSAFAEIAGIPETDVYMDDFYIELKKAGLAERAKANLDFKEIIFCIGLTALAGFCIFEIVRVIGRQKRKEARLKTCRQLYDTDAEYARGISEVNLPETSYYKQCRLYITPDYVVSCKEGVEVFRIEDIRELYGYDKSEHSISMFLLFGMFAAYRMNHYLAAVTSDEELHMFAELSVVGKLHNEIVRKLILKNPSMMIGRNNTPAAELSADSKDFKLSKVPGFYGNTEVWKGRVKEDFVV